MSDTTKTKKRKKRRQFKIHPDALVWQERRKEIYKFYLTFLIQNGRTPTLTEIGKKFNFTRARAGAIIKKMEKEGFVVKIQTPPSRYWPIDFIVLPKVEKNKTN